MGNFIFLNISFSLGRKAPIVPFEKSAIVKKKKVKMLQRHDEMKFFLFAKARNTSCLARTHVKDLENNFLASRACRKGRVKSQTRQFPPC